MVKGDKSMVKVNRIRACFHKHGVQIPPEVIEMIDDAVERYVENLAENCKFANLSRVTAQSFWLAEGRFGDNRIEGRNVSR